MNISSILEIKSEDRRKYLLVAAAFLVLLILMFQLIPFLKSARPSYEEIALKEKTLSKYKEIVKQNGKLHKRLKILNSEIQRLESALLTGQTPALAAVDIQNALNKITGKRGVEISRVRVLKKEEVAEGKYLRIPVQFTIESDIRQLKEIVYGIASSEKCLTLEKITISVIRRRGSGKVRSEMTVAGLMKRPG
jgi:Tfp pilus assembly protein PilO